MASSHSIQLYCPESDEITPNQVYLHSILLLAQYESLITKTQVPNAENEVLPSVNLVTPIPPIKTHPKRIKSHNKPGSIDFLLDDSDEESLSTNSSNFGSLPPSTSSNPSTLSREEEGDNFDGIDEWVVVDEIAKSPKRKKSVFLETRASHLFGNTSKIKSTLLDSTNIDIDDWERKEAQTVAPGADPLSSENSHLQPSKAPILPLSTYQAPFTYLQQPVNIEVGNEHKPTSDTKPKSEDSSKTTIKARHQAIFEIIETENRYLEGIELMLRNGLIPMLKKSDLNISGTLELLDEEAAPSGFDFSMVQLGSQIQQQVTVLMSQGRSSPQLKIENFTENRKIDFECVPVLEAVDIATIFSNLESIYIMNTELLKKLNQVLANWSKLSTIGDIFIQLSPFFKAYCTYVDNLQNALNRLDQLQASSWYIDDYLNKFKNLPRSRKLNLKDYLATPVQRLPRYILLLQTVYKSTPTTHPDYLLLQRAIHEFTVLANYVNDSAENSVQRSKVIELQKRFVMGPSEIVAPARLLLKEGKMMKLSLTDGGLQQREVFLFTDALLTATPVMSGFLKQDKLEHLQSIAIMDRTDVLNRHSFYVVSESKTHVLICEGAKEKKEWMEAIDLAAVNLITKAPWMERERNKFAIHVGEDDGIPYLIPKEAIDDLNHPVYDDIRNRKGQSQLKNVLANTYQTLRSWFSPSS